MDIHIFVLQSKNERTGKGIHSYQVLLFSKFTFFSKLGLGLGIGFDLGLGLGLVVGLS